MKTRFPTRRAPCRWARRETAAQGRHRGQAASRRPAGASRDLGLLAPGPTRRPAGQLHRGSEHHRSDARADGRRARARNDSQPAEERAAHQPGVSREPQGHRRALAPERGLGGDSRLHDDSAAQQHRSLYIRSMRLRVGLGMYERFAGEPARDGGEYRRLRDGQHRPRRRPQSTACWPKAAATI